MPTWRPIARRERLVVRKLPGELLMYDLERHEAHCLNDTAAVVWRGCDGRRSVAEIGELLAGGPEAERLAQTTLEELGRRNLLEGPIPERPEAKSGVSRRVDEASSNSGGGGRAADHDGGGADGGAGADLSAKRIVMYDLVTVLQRDLQCFRLRVGMLNRRCLSLSVIPTNLSSIRVIRNAGSLLPTSLNHACRYTSHGRV